MYGMFPPWHQSFTTSVPPHGETQFIPDVAKQAMNEHLALMREINRKLDNIEALLRQK
ncbi:hypothetical protein [Melghirimyces algeriensis]|uniref:Uncharacterized protein n=1 Tax=Melghirimyces algeriensis TaxID=910412 RepID=A0A521F2C0_9BACL|nr:hypothetical protein [Melghirimyces algeriensis]SMO89781.1 hypothetical protein SAMN06264849_11210 [Melghirimyces algeriensis]